MAGKKPAVASSSRSVKRATFWQTIKRAVHWVARFVLDDLTEFSSTACLGDGMKWFGQVGPIGHFFGLIPKVEIFKASELVESIHSGGFEMEIQWQKDKSIARFVIAKKVLP